MTDLTRRHLLQGLAAAPLLSAVPRIAQAATTWVRYDILSPKGQEMLAIYADAIRIMQTRGPEDPLSWRWQWYTHFVDGATSKNAEITRLWGTNTTPQRTLAQEVWNTCQPHSGQNPNFFLPWHRFYTWMGERIVRRVTGRQDFTMPYWNYTTSDPLHRGVVPNQFRMPDDPVFGVLYRPNRSSLANTGQPIHMNQPGDVMNIDEALRKTNYETVGSEMGFCRTIDSSIHGRVHVLTGTSRGMGGVVYAGDDPLFYVHHANVDRMWASWNKMGNKNPTDATLSPWINTEFALASEWGLRMARSCKNLYSALQLGYDYDAFFARPAPLPPPETQTATLMAAKSGTNAVATKVASATNMANLGATTTTVRMARLSTAKQTDVLGVDADARRTLLVLRKLHTWKQPGVLYHVYLVPTPNTPPSAAYYAGNINFFDAEFHEHGGGSKLDSALGENFHSFDVTALLKGIAKRPHGREASEMLFVKLVPGGKPDAAAKPMIAQFDLVRQ